MESELFGHEKGAFTGAIGQRKGCFEMAHGGTLFLDEIAEMPLALQPKLLRVLEDGKVRRIGGRGEIQVDVRHLAATNKDPEEAIKKGQLREDLYYRLNVLRLHLPPLRERAEDIAAAGRRTSSITATAATAPRSRGCRTSRGRRSSPTRGRATCASCAT